MSPYFPLESAEPAPYWCPNCVAWFITKKGMENISCTVNHGPGGCCHEYEEKLEPGRRMKGRA